MDKIHGREETVKESLRQGRKGSFPTVKESLEQGRKVFFPTVKKSLEQGRKMFLPRVVGAPQAMEDWCNFSQNNVPYAPVISKLHSI